MGRRALAWAAVAVALTGGLGGVTHATWTDSTGATSSFTADADFVPVVTSIADISRTPREGSELTVNTADWTYTPDSHALQWLRCDTNGATCVDATGAGATTVAYTPTAADVGATLRVELTATNGAATSAPHRTEPTDVVVATLASEPQNVVMPTVSAAGGTYTANTGTWTGFAVNQLPEYRWQWFRCDSTGGSCSAIEGTETAYSGMATTNAYTATAADRGRRLRAKVTVRVIGLNNPASVLTADTDVVP